MTRRRLQPARRLAALVVAGVATVLVSTPALHHAAASQLEIDPGMLATYTFPGPEVEVTGPPELSQPAPAEPEPGTVPPSVAVAPAPDPTFEVPAEPTPVPAHNPDEVEDPGVTEPPADVIQGGVGKESLAPLEQPEMLGPQPAAD